MTSKSFITRIAAAIMTAVLLATSLYIPVSAAGSASYELTETYGATVSGSDLPSALNLTHSAGAIVRTAGVGDIINRLTGATVSEAEEAYLSSLGISMKFNEDITRDLVKTEFFGERVTFSASEQSYTAENGSSVRWIPVSVSFNGEEKNFSSNDGSYTASFSGVEKDKTYTASIDYKTTVTVDADEMSQIINLAYNNAKAAISALSEYDKNIGKFNTAQTAYQSAIKKYESDYSAYQAYLKALDAYNLELSAYNDYLDKLEAYEAAAEKYNEYLKALEAYKEEYKKYESEKAEFDEQQELYEKYLKYQAVLNQATKQLDVLNSIFIKDSEGRMMYATLIGDTVDQVLENKYVLINAAGVSEEDINNADSSTKALRKLLTEYKGIKDIDEQLRWYAENYSSLKENFILLYSSLYNLGNNSLVEKVLKSKGKWKRYAQFVGQLYIISTGLDDSITFSATWNYKTFKLSDIVEAVQYIQDDNSYSPKNVTLPERMEPVEKPIVPTAPKKPTAVSAPVKTWTTVPKNPGEAPVSVSKPVKPVLSVAVPTMPEISKELAAVIELVREGKLTKRSMTADSASVTYSKTIAYSTANSKSHLVSFYTHDGKALLYSMLVKNGSSAAYMGEMPSREDDEKYLYSFSGWVDGEGERADLSNIKSDVALYAKYNSTLREYTVTWQAKGETSTQKYKYGEIPSYDGDPSYQDGTYNYTFTGWSSAVGAVSGDVTYTAQYVRRELDSLSGLVAFEIGEDIYYRVFAYGTVPTFDDFEKDYIVGIYRYVFSGWSSELLPVSSDAKYTAHFKKTVAFPAGDDGGGAGEMTVTKNEYIISTSASVVDASYAVSAALKAGTGLVLRLGDTTVTFDNKTLKTIPTAAKFRLQKTAKSGKSWLFEITDENGNRLNINSEVLVELSLSETDLNHGNLNVYINGKSKAATVQNGRVYLRLSESGTIELRPYYTLSISTEGSGDVTLEANTAEAGSPVKLLVELEKGWRIEKIMMSVNGGEETELELTDGTFIMPEGDVVLRAILTEGRYTVIFIANGVEISRESYEYGENAIVPDMNNNLAYEKDGVTYTFAGWDSMLSPVTKDITYTAVYKKGVVGNQDSTWISEYNSNKLVTVVLPIFGGIALTVTAALLVAYFIIKKKIGGAPVLPYVKEKCAPAFAAVGSFFKNVAKKCAQAFSKIGKSVAKDCKNIAECARLIFEIIQEKIKKRKK